MNFDSKAAELELEKLKAQAQAANNALTKAKGRQEVLNENLKGYHEELRKLGISPENLDSEIEKLIAEYNTLIEDVKNKIPLNLLQRIRMVDANGNPTSR